jgi:hypothetical protein
VVKRIAVRLESFDTVDLAFEGVASTGQAFADKLFRVFGKRHAHVRLQPRNMSASVVAMVAQAEAV